MIHHAHRAGRHFTVAFTRFDRVSQYAQAKGVFQALPGIVNRAQQFIAEVEVGRIKRFVLNIFGGVERVQRTDDNFFRHGARKQTHGRLPVILMDADRFKDWRDDPAYRGEGGVINVIDDFAAQRETVKRAQENTHDDNDFTGA